MIQPDQTAVSLVDEIGELIATQFLAQVGSPERDLLASGILDSLTLVQLLVSLEERFHIRIPLQDLDIEDIRSVRSIARLVENYEHSRH